MTGSCGAGVSLPHLASLLYHRIWCLSRGFVIFFTDLAGVPLRRTLSPHLTYIVYQKFRKSQLLNLSVKHLSAECGLTAIEEGKEVKIENYA